MSQMTRFCFALAALVLAACSALVDPESLVIKCEVAAGSVEPDPCLEAGMHCVAGVCQVCEGAREDCNGIDDDCDGKIDEGHDQDGDGYSWCGGGVPELADCVPTDPDIHPVAQTDLDEKSPTPVKGPCDGKDNDCDGQVDESDEASGCGSTGCSQTGCAGALVCDAKSDRCIAPRPVGADCATDAECMDGFCVDPELFGFSKLEGKRCASACCTDTDCKTGNVCEVGVSGAHACVPSEIAGRGANQTGQDCSTGSDCASGFCVRGSCTKRCSSETGCDDESCVISPGSADESQTWMCGEAIGRGNGGAICTSFDPTSCKSGVCEGTTCAAPCGRNKDCSSGICSYIDVSTLIPPSSSRLPICTKATEGPAADVVCCTNSDCAEGPGGTCKPKLMTGTLFGMTCQLD